MEKLYLLPTIHERLFNVPGQPMFLIVEQGQKKHLSF